MRFEPNGLVVRGHKEIHVADSIPDYLFRAIGLIVREHAERWAAGPVPSKNENPGNHNNGKVESDSPAGVCPSCSRLTLEKGAGCEKICVCGYQDFSGCGG